MSGCGAGVVRGGGVGVMVVLVMAGERSPFSPPLEVSSNDSKRDTVILSSFRLSMRLYFSCLLLAFRSILLQLKQRKR